MSKPDVIVVSDPWQELGLSRPLSSLLPRAARSLGAIGHSWKWSFLAAVLTVVIHLIMGIALFSNSAGAWVSDPIPNRLSADVPELVSDSQVMSVMLITEGAITESTDTAKRLLEVVAESELPLSTTQAIPPAGIEPMEDQPVVHSAAGPGEAPLARTPQEIYLDQIRARIDRAWSDSKGRRLVAGKCRVGIRQASTGTVTEVEFIRCLATGAWKQSLSQAIRYASPLPAPPDETVFSEEVVLDF